MQMPLLNLKNDQSPLLFESEDPAEVWKLFCELQNKLPKALWFNEANYERNELMVWKNELQFLSRLNYSSGRDLVIRMSVRRAPSAVRRPWFLSGAFLGNRVP